MQGNTSVYVVIVSLRFTVRAFLSFTTANTEIVVGYSFSHCCASKKQPYIKGELGRASYIQSLIWFVQVSEI